LPGFLNIIAAYPVNPFILANRGSDICSILDTTNTIQGALAVAVPTDILVVVFHVPEVGVEGIVLRSTPPDAVVADIDEIIK
jgi:hypothetical protein